MRIAVPTSDWLHVAGHAGRARQWLVWDLAGFIPGAPLPEPARVELAADQVFHHFRDEGPHPLDGVDLVVAGSAGDGFVRHLKKRGTEVVLTGENEPALALARIIAGETLPDPRFDITTALCKLHDLFSRH